MYLSNVSAVTGKAKTEETNPKLTNVFFIMTLFLVFQTENTQQCSLPDWTVDISIER
ncbi:hypothetical protein VIBNISFn118_830063 [Vibrio nigripulchritudo SFn118]|nr:hypothetical protein VIBNISFn118_830063 [Vibrio nigripulchritudo SFn118]